MAVEWRDDTRADGTPTRTIVVSSSSDWSLFDRIARDLAKSLGGTWVAGLDGVDERYWDLDARAGRITLHLQHYLGISACIASGRDGDAASRALLDEVFDRLRCYDPA